MSHVIVEVMQWPDTAEDPLRQESVAATICILREARQVDIGVDVIKMPAGRIYLRFNPEALAAALAAAMFDGDE